eukprot:306326_1
MSSFLDICILNIAVLSSITSSTTSNCNYVIDLWYETATPPTAAPTAAPTRSPTTSPTAAPTYYNESDIPMTTGEWEDSLNGASSSSGLSILLFLNQYALNYCY